MNLFRLLFFFGAWLLCSFTANTQNSTQTYSQTSLFPSIKDTIQEVTDENVHIDSTTFFTYLCCATSGTNHSFETKYIADWQNYYRSLTKEEQQQIDEWTRTGLEVVAMFVGAEVVVIKLLSKGKWVYRVLGASKYVSISKIPKLGKKLDFLFGKASGTRHNIERSTAMMRQLNKIGIYDNPNGRKILQEHLIKVLNRTDNIVDIQKNGRLVKESLLVGRLGSIKVTSVWDNDKLITVILKGAR